MSKKHYFFYYCCVVFFFFPSFAHAYLDPGTGNALIYALITLMGAALYLAKEGVYKIQELFNGKQAGTKKKQAAQNDILLFSEGKNYWLTFKPLVEALLVSGTPFSYITLDVEDPALTIEHPLMHSRFLGTGSAAFARASRYTAKVMLSTTPNIGNKNYPMARPAGVACLAHVCHGVGDIALYNQGSLDSYDAVLMVGDFMLPSIRRIEELRSLKPKECLALGLPYLDELAAHGSPKQEQSAPPVVLIAPSWGEKSSLKLYGTELVRLVAQAGYHVILRPHPHSFLAEKDLMDALFRELAAYPNVSIDTEVDGTAAMSKADIMISDKSCVRFDFAFLYEKPVISLDIPLMHPEIYEYADLGVIWEDTVAARLGPVLKPENFSEIVKAVQEALAMPATSLAAMRDECVACQGYSGKAIIDWTLAKCRGKEA